MSAPADRQRVFFALWPDAAVADALAWLGTILAPEGARCMARDTLHLTLAFVGDIDTSRLPSVIESGDAVEWPRLSLTVDEFGLWGHNHIIWAGPNARSPALAGLADAIAQALGARGMILPARPFRPHVTLVRKATRMEHDQPIDPIHWSSDGGVLVRSERTPAGARYQVIARWSAH